MRSRFFYIFTFSVFLVSCSNSDNDSQVQYVPTPVSIEAPDLFGQLLPDPLIPTDNPMTEEGVLLGRSLFFDPILSGDGTQSCANCHGPQFSFSDMRRFSVGIDGSQGTRNSMPLYNLAWNFENDFFWDGRANSLEEQALDPVTSPFEMNNTWEAAVASLQQHPRYPELFAEAFGTDVINRDLVTKALAQFERTLISGNSKFDRHLLGIETLSESEQNGFNIFMDEDRGDCFHCHGSDNNPLWTDNRFHNNGLDEVFSDLGLGGETGDPRENGLFKSPSLRNLAFTAPYMHDGRFQTLEEVINHYSEGLVYSETIDPLMKKVAEGGVGLSEADKADLKAFLLSLSDPSFIDNPDFQRPN